VLGNDDEHPLRDPELAQAGEDESRLDRLAEADLVREHEARVAVGEDAAGGADLVREDVHPRGEERAQTAGAPERLEASHLRPEAERGGAARLPGRERVERARRAHLLDGRVLRHRRQRRVPAGDDRHAVPAGEADRQAAAVVPHLDDDPHPPAALRAVHDLHPWFPAHAARLYHPIPRGVQELRSEEGPSPAGRAGVDSPGVSS
jgi:hypothetical protein